MSKRKSARSSSAVHSLEHDSAAIDRLIQEGQAKDLQRVNERQAAGGYEAALKQGFEIGETRDLCDDATGVAERMCKAADIVKAQWGDIWLRHRLAERRRALRDRSDLNVSEAMDHHLDIVATEIVVLACDNHHDEVRRRLEWASDPSRAVGVCLALSRMVDYLTAKFRCIPRVPPLEYINTTLARLVEFDESSIRDWRKEGKMIFDEEQGYEIVDSDRHQQALRALRKKPESLHPDFAVNGL